MQEKEIPEINLFSDGSAEPNPGKGGFGVILSYKNIQREFSQGYELTTNNRMELMGVIYGLEKLKTKSVVNVFTDSRYVINGIEKGWAIGWKAKNWLRTKNQLAANHDLWEKLLTLIATQESVKFNWVKGHAGHKENERCDELARLAASSTILLPDPGYQPEPITEKYSGIEEFIIPQTKGKSKFYKEGDPCRKCGRKLNKKQPKKMEIKPGQTYFYEYILICLYCKTIYFTDEAKKPVPDAGKDLFS